MSDGDEWYCEMLEATRVEHEIERLWARCIDEMEDANDEN